MFKYYKVNKKIYSYDFVFGYLKTQMEDTSGNNQIIVHSSVLLSYKSQFYM